MVFIISSFDDDLFAESRNKSYTKPADFFRTMEDASGIDLDWFWRGWFYTNDYVDISIDDVKWFKIGEPSLNKSDDIDKFKNATYFKADETQDTYYGEFKGRLNEKEFMSKIDNKEFYELTFSNKGGLVMPVLLDFEFEDGTTKRVEIPAEIWRTNEQVTKKVFFFDKKLVTVTLDKNEETADVDISNNSFPRENVNTDFEKFKNKLKGR